MTTSIIQRRLEEKLEKKLIGLPTKSHPKMGLTLQKFFVTKTSDRWKAGKPDLRIGRSDMGQLDVELKYIDWPKQSIDEAREIDIGATKLQWLIIREMNEHGLPAVFLVYVEAYDRFIVTTDRVLRAPFHWGAPHAIAKLPDPQVIDGVVLFTVAREYLKNAGYR